MVWHWQGSQFTSLGGWSMGEHERRSGAKQKEREWRNLEMENKRKRGLEKNSGDSLGQDDSISNRNDRWERRKIFDSPMKIRAFSPLPEWSSWNYTGKKPRVETGESWTVGGMKKSRRPLKKRKQSSREHRKLKKINERFPEKISDNMVKRSGGSTWKERE